MEFHTELFLDYVHYKGRCSVWGYVPMDYAKFLAWQGTTWWHKHELVQS